MPADRLPCQLGPLEAAESAGIAKDGFMTSLNRQASPATATPARRPGSVRRTTTHDSLRPDGLQGPVTVVARGRDLRTTPDGGTTVLDTARLDLEVSHPEH